MNRDMTNSSQFKRPFLGPFELRRIGQVSVHIMITPRFGICDVIIGDYFLLF